MERLFSHLGRWAGLVAVPLCLGLAYLIVYYAPVEKIQGPIQKMMYLHVGSILTSYLAFAVVAVSGGMFLWLRRPHWDRLARSSAELGILFCTVCLITGPLWGKPVWGVFWVWDARLTSTLLLWLIYGVTFVVREAAPGEQGARFAAVIGMVGLLNVPFIHVAAERFRTLHPPNVMKGGMTPEMGLTLMFAILTCMVLYVTLLSRRVVQASLSDAIRAMERELAER